LRTELDLNKRRQLVEQFLKMAFPPNGIGMGTARKDQLSEAFKIKPTGYQAQTAISGFIKSVGANPSQATVSAMSRELSAAFE